MGILDNDLDSDQCHTSRISIWYKNYGAFAHPKICHEIYSSNQLDLNRYKRNKPTQIDLLNERELQAIKYAEAYQKRMARHYAKSIIK